MLWFIVGLVLLLLPFGLVGFFDDKIRGFVTVLFLWLSAETLLAVITQALGIFSFGVIFAGNILLVICGYLFAFKKNAGFKKIQFDWALAAVIIFSAAALWQVHFHYSGPVSFATDVQVGYHQVSGLRYPFPYFSDEWDAIAWINSIIQTHRLPFSNPFNHVFFLNITFAFYSLLAGICVLLKANPLYAFVWISLFANCLIIILAYIFLRLSGIPKGASCISALSLLFIASTANLPTFWYLLSVNAGLLFFLLGMCFLQMKKMAWAAIAAIPLAFFYPPFILFYTLLWIPAIAQTSKKNPVLAKRVAAWTAAGFGLGLVIIAVGAFFISQENLAFLASKIWYPSLSGDYIPQYYFYIIIPLWSFCLFLFAVPQWRRRLWIFLPLILGIIFWAAYSLATFRFLIEYERIAFFVSVLLVIVSAFGLESICRYLDKRFSVFGKPASVFLLSFLAFGLLALLPFYTLQNRWQQLVLLDPATGDTIAPKAPANEYLTQSDLTVFTGIHNATFLSIPWKGLVLGVATGNTPLLTKEGTISVGSQTFLDRFQAADCQVKLAMAKNQKLNYIYLYPFQCPGFQALGEDTEGLELQKVL